MQKDIGNYEVAVESFHYDNDICTKMRLLTGVVIKDFSSGCAFIIPFFSSAFTDIGC